MIQIDMKMPKDCYHCPCHKHWDVNNYICGITGDTANYIGFRRDFCPLKEASNGAILDKIRAEIEQYQSDYDVHGTEYDRTAWKAFNRCLRILDKYKAESEE